jgi:hypothetical protein
MQKMKAIETKLNNMPLALLNINANSEIEIYDINKFNIVF